LWRTIADKRAVQFRHTTKLLKQASNLSNKLTPCIDPRLVFLLYVLQLLRAYALLHGILDVQQCAGPWLACDVTIKSA
jgi:hypothetical protein